MNLLSENPFCASRIRPGAMPFLFSDDRDAARLVERLARHRWRGQIIGPHGSGKSSLLAAIEPEIARTGRRTRLIALHDGQRRLPRDIFEPPPQVSDVLIVDGYEQLGRLERLRLRLRCRLQDLGLLVTSHRGVGLPDIFLSVPNLATAQRIVCELQRGYPAYVTSEDVMERYGRHGGDLRELLFDLYDLYRTRRISATSA